MPGAAKWGRAPLTFVQGSWDAFGTLDELRPDIR
jgi:hypothetical protein